MQDKRVKPTLLLYGRIPPPLSQPVGQSASRPVGLVCKARKRGRIWKPVRAVEEREKNGAAAFRFPIGLRSGRLHRRRHSPQPDRGMGVKGRKDDF